PLTLANPIPRAMEGSIGVPLPVTQARFVDPQVGVDEVPGGEIGELVIRGPQVMAGYWRKPQETNDVLQDGWLHTGDLARMDDEGYFYIVDRKKDVINAAGFKVWPREVEEVLFEHRMVELAAVVGVADRYRGETVKAVLVLRKEFRGRPDSEVREDLLRHCRSKLAAYKVPRLLEVRDSLPVSAAGKVLRRELKG
ncbi:MAG: AMP-binding protein, partial [Dehalococcoidia bacterium]|nr:AMP-binding protein [Dehalococcoidia bacterium]